MPMQISRRKLDWLIIGYLSLVVIVLTASIHPVVRLNKIKVLSIRSDYLLHALLLIPWMILAAWRWGAGSRGRSAFWLALAAGILMTGFLEGLQLAIPYRSASNNDLLANIAGLTIGALISLRWHKAVGRQ